MTLTSSVLGNRLRQARVNAGFTQEEAADAIELQRTALLQIESGNRNVSSIELFRLAKLYNIEVSSLLAEEAEEQNLLVALCRARADFAKDTRLTREVERYLSIFSKGVELDGLLGHRFQTVAPVYEMPDPQGYPEAIRQGEAMAAQERRRLNLANGPIPDVAEIISSQGIWACSSALPDDLSGLFMHHPTIGMAIIVNSTHHSRGRRRFSYAHEYAHALADRGRAPATVTSKENSRELVEKRANAFAGEFLLPAAGVKEVLTRLDKGAASREMMWIWDAATGDGEAVERRNKPGSQAIGYQDVVHLAHEFAVSYETATYRLSDMGVISRAEVGELIGRRDQAYQLLDVLKLFARDQNESENEQPLLIKQLGLKGLEALRRGAISGEEFLTICEMLNIGSTDAKQLLSLAKQPC